MFAHYAPRLYNYYAKNFASLRNSQPELKLPIDTSIFTSISFNLASQVVVSEHKNFKNLAYGLCAICALGNFDPKLSDHFILWELKLLIDFPAASIIIIPSTFSHGNVGLQVGETRYSLIQYSAGGLFHWVKYGFRKWEKFKKDDPKKTRAEWSARPTGWQEVLGLFCNISEFASL